MKELIEQLKKENQDILHKNPKLVMEFDWSSDAYRLQYNEEMISKLKNLIIADISKSIAKQYAEFCVRCDREGLPLLELDDYIKQYCC